MFGACNVMGVKVTSHAPKITKHDFFVGRIMDDGGWPRVRQTAARLTRWRKTMRGELHVNMYYKMDDRRKHGSISTY